MTCVFTIPESKHFKSAARRELQARQVIEAWNKAHPIGARVCVHRDNGERVATHTRSNAFLTSDGGSAVARVDGISGYYCLTHIHPLGAPEKTDAE